MFDNTSIVLKYDHSWIIIISINMFIVGISNYCQKEGKKIILYSNYFYKLIIEMIVNKKYHYIKICSV